MSKLKIESVDAYVAGHWLFVSVTTDTGLTGIGEATYFIYPRAAALIVEELADYYKGADPFRAEYLFNGAFKSHCMRDSAYMSALSAIDQALWDIKGKALDVPVWELLGGRVRDRVRAILLIEAQTKEEILQKARAAAAEGFSAIKLKPFVGEWASLTRAKLFAQTAEIISAVRTDLGADMDIAIEIHRNLTPNDAIEFAALIADQSPYFIEDPILPFSVESNRYVSDKIGMPVAIAERNTTIWEFREYSDCHGVAILRPDVGLAGGFTQMKKIAAIAESRHQRIVPHNFTSPVATACHIQLAASTSNWDVQGYVREDRQPWTDVVKSINVLKNGYLEIPETPGIGVELNMDYLKTAPYVPFGSKFGHGALTGADGAFKHQ